MTKEAAQQAIDRLNRALKALRESQETWERRRDDPNVPIMREDIQSRWALSAILRDVPYNTAFVLPDAIVQRLWPPTGEADNSYEGNYRAMLLSNAGHRPETSMTTEERIKNDLPADFGFHHDDWKRIWLFERPLDACPKCKGYGRYQDYDQPRGLPLLRTGPVSVEESTITIVERECDHMPEEKDDS